MKTAAQIRTDFMSSNYQINTSCAFFKEMHNNGHTDVVKNFLLRGNDNTVTYDLTRAALCTHVDTSFNDYRGEYAGSIRQYFYMGVEVDKTTSYSLFN